MDVHSHQHAHPHPQPTFNRAFLIAIIANGLFVICQVIFASMANSTSLLADAFHNLGDVISLILAWIATSLMKRQPTQKSSYGLKKVSILAALANGILLVFSCGIIATEALYKFITPAPVHITSVIVIASLGIVINGATAMLFMRDSEDLNIRGAFLHLFFDALVSAGVVLSAILLYFTGWLWVDPAMGLIIAAVILKGTWGLFKDSFRLIIDAVPTNVSLQTIHDFLLQQEGVESLHDLHIWALSTQENALSVHLFMPKAPLNDNQRFELIRQLKKDYALHHITIQVESTANTCDEVCST
jgi:cobalt-zinc-cadmium efflux system protein